jgi:cullin-4
MPRNKALMKKRGTGTGGGTSSAPKKIVIKPFSKPPTLPPNYYEQTSTELLNGTMNIIFNNNDTTSNNLSLQNSYQQVVNLVSHQYGSRLYHDLVLTLQKACQEYVLPSTSTSLLSEESSSASVLGYIQQQYQKYVDYLLLCKHVFLPLDRSHAYTSNGDVLKRSGSGSGAGSTESTTKDIAMGRTTTTTTTTTSNCTNTTTGVLMMGLWQIGLEKFRLRLQEFHYDELIYNKWYDSLKQDYDDMLPLDEQTLLQSTLYMWQDLGIISTVLTTKLEPDLIQLFQNKSEQLKQSSSSAVVGATPRGGDTKYNATTVIAYCFDKWMHVAYHWSRFLPKSTCVYLLENHLFKPHLNDDWLLNPTNFHPILEEAFTTTTMASTTTLSAGVLASPTATTTTSSSPIQQLWMLAGRLVGGYKVVGNAIAQYARTRGAALMNVMGNNPTSSSGADNAASRSSFSAAKAGKQKISDLLDLQRQVRQLLSQLPHANEYCALKSVWEDVINPSNDSSETNSVAEALAKYVDTCLRDNKRQLASSSSSSSPLDNNGNWAEAVISGVFIYLQAKDVFEAFYKQDLAKRLLLGRIVSLDVERHFVSLLKAECGAGYTSKMEGMFQDMDWSRETMARYKQTLYQDNPLVVGGATSDNSQVEMDIQVLTTGYWPVYPQYPKLILPEFLVEPQNKFLEYYKSKYQGRRITWQYALGNCVVRFKTNDSPGPKFELNVNLCQALVLLQFNNNDDLTLPQIQVAVGLEDRGEMERVLLSLSMGKDGTRVLQKIDHDASETKKKTRPDVQDQDLFRVQSNFKSNQRRIRIPNIQMKETREEREKTVEAVSRDRLYLIDAVLVRIMKARKTILHQQLIPQVLEQLKVPAQPADVKKRIETLIEREYMERDKEDRSRYNYLA